MATRHCGMCKKSSRKGIAEEGDGPCPSTYHVEVRQQIDLEDAPPVLSPSRLEPVARPENAGEKAEAVDATELSQRQIYQLRRRLWLWLRETDVRQYLVPDISSLCTLEFGTA